MYSFQVLISEGKKEGKHDILPNEQEVDKVSQKFMWTIYYYSFLQYILLHNVISSNLWTQLDT